ncbi:MAG: MucBP domain-containing protein [Bacteroidales bacterium]|jgi:hypothetical protein|nr:MucBP domain-containing protein [Bacteroidales bacterium]
MKHLINNIHKNLFRALIALTSFAAVQGCVFDPIYDLGSVSIRYLDSATGEEIQPSTPHGGLPAGNYAYTHPDIAGWSFNSEKSDSGKGTIGYGENVTVKFYYDRQKQSITIRYLDAATDEEIQPSVTHSDVPAGPYSYTAPDIAGWAFNAEKSDPGKGTITAGESIVIRFYYDRLKQSITIRYLHSATDEEIRPSVTHSDVPVGPYSYTAPYIDGYTFNAQKSDPGKGTIAAGQSIVIRFYYDEWLPDPVFQTITIRYLDSGTDEEILSPVIYDNVPVGPYSYTHPDIEGYRFNVDRSDSGSGTIGEGENITVTFYYNRLVTLVIVHMLQSDAGGYDLLTSRVVKHVIGETIVGSECAYDIPGYSFDYSDPAEITITEDTEDNQRITLYYGKDNT